MSDLVASLRAYANNGYMIEDCIVDEAADEIERLREKVRREQDNVDDLEDSKELLRKLGSEVCGCEHVDGPDERRVQVHHIREAFELLKAENLALTEEIEQLKDEQHKCRTPSLRNSVKKIMRRLLKQT